METYFKYQQGYIKIVGNNNGIREISFVEEKKHDQEPECLEEAKRQIREYFEGTRRAFDLKLDFQVGTEFQQKVWNALLNVYYGETKTYKDIAEEIGSPKAFRAVGMANNKNPIALVVP